MTKASSPRETLASGFHLIPIGDLIESPMNTRRHWPAEAQAELERSIAKSGILTPLLVRPASDGSARFEIAAGHRRYRAAKKTKRSPVPAIVRPMTDEELKEIIAIENLQREDLHPLDEAAGLEQLLGADRSLAAIEGVAARIGKSVSYVYQRLKLLALAPAVQEAFLKDQLTAGHAILLARLELDRQLDLLERFLRPRRHEEGMSVRRLADVIVQESHQLSAAPFKTSDATLVPAAGACSVCPKRSDHQAELFAGGAGELESGGKARARCLDGACWAAKVAAKVAQAKAELEAATGAPAVEIAAGYVPWGEKLPEGVVAPTQWVEVPKKEKGAVAAVVVRGDSQDHKIGDTVYVKVGKGRGTRRAKPTKSEQKWRKREAARAEKRAAAQALGEAIRTRVADKLAKGITLRALLVKALEPLLDQAAQTAELDEYLAKLAGYPGSRKARAKWEATAKPAQLLLAIQLAALFDDMALVQPDGVPTFLLEAAKALRVDPKKVAAELKAAAAAPK